MHRMDTPPPRRLHLPRHAPHSRVCELRAQGWTDAQIAAAIGASPRAVVRWAAGDTRPLPVYEANLARLPSAPAARTAATSSSLNEESTP